MNVETTISPPAWTWVVPLAVAVIALAGVVASLIVQTRNFKRQTRAAHALKLAEMQHKWIYDLREAMSTFFSYGITPQMDHINERECYEHGARIELMMNPEDQYFEELQNCIYKFLVASDIDEKFEVNGMYVAVCQRIMKREWEVLKSEIREIP